MNPRRHPSILLIGLFLISASTVSAGELEVGGYTFRFEDPVVAKDPPRAMTQGGVVIPAGDADETADANFYYFGPGRGGSVEANVARWIGQFEEEPEREKEELKFGDRTVVILRAEGTYLDGRPFGPKTPHKDYALLGAIIEGGDAPVFVKLYGPKKEVDAVAAAFKALVLSPFAKD